MVNLLMYVSIACDDSETILTSVTGDWYTGSQGFQGACTPRICLNISRSCSVLVSFTYDLLISNDDAFITHICIRFMV